MSISPGKSRKEALTSLRRLRVDRGAGAGGSGVKRQRTRVRPLELRRVKIPRPRQTVHQMPALR
jgi:hypothetical protein